MKIHILKELIKSTIREVFNRKVHQTPTLKYHENAKLEVAREGPYGPFLFFRNGQPFALVDEFGPERRGDQETFRLDSIAIIRSLRKVGLGRAIFTYLFDIHPNLQNIQLRSTKSGKPFYQKIGGEREDKEFTVKRNKFQPSSLKFTEIPYTSDMHKFFPSFFKSIWK